MTSTTWRNESDNIVLEEHIRLTFPEDEDGYLGREHFWAMGDQSGYIDRHIAGTAHTEVCFPIKHRVRRDPPSARFGSSIFAPVDPSVVGLDVKTRHEVGLAYPPVAVTNFGGSRRLRAHLDRPWNTQPVADRIIRAGSLIKYMTSPELDGKILHSDSALEALSTFVVQLIEAFRI